VILELEPLNRHIEQQVHSPPRSIASLYAPANVLRGAIDLQVTKRNGPDGWFGPMHVWIYRSMPPRPLATDLEFDSEFGVPDVLRVMAYLKRFAAEHGWRPLGRLLFHRSQEDAASDVPLGSIFVQLLMSREAFEYAWTLRTARQQRLRLSLDSPKLELMYDGTTQRWNLNDGDSIPIDEASLSAFKPRDEDPD